MKCFCGKSAITFNNEGIPCCVSHKNKKIPVPLCPECGLKMQIKKSKFGVFWGCIAFPSCTGIKKI
jgi:ssDNA-binding Zn-finger/Zn-ribbon topoisomerase 1